MTYEILPVTGEPDWSRVECAELKACAWSPNAAPRTELQAVYTGGELLIRLTSHEHPARAVNTEPNSSVWEDNCLESFLSFDGRRYMNLEVNANSAMRAGFGTSRADRTPLLSMDIPMPEAVAAVCSDSWCVTYHISPETVEALFGVKLHRGLEFYGNFYSCGDKTPLPHYSAWSSVDTPQPDFHRPEFFGTLMIK